MKAANRPTAGSSAPGHHTSSACIQALSSRIGRWTTPREHDFGPVRRGEGDPELRRGRRENAGFAAGVGLEFDAAAHEQSFEFADGVTVVPALNQERFPPQAHPIDGLALGVWMFAGDRGAKPLAVQ